MEPTWGMLQNMIKREYCLQGEMKCNLKQIIKKVLILNEDTDMEDDTLYLTSSEVKIRQNKKAIVLRLMKDEQEKPEKDVVCLSYTEGHIFSVINRILTIFTQLQQWMDAMQRVARLEKDMRKLVKCCAEYLDMGIVIVNSEYEIHEYEVQPWMGFEWSDMKGSDGRMSSESIEELYRDGAEFEKTFDKIGLSRYQRIDEKEESEVCCYYQNFMDDEQRYLGRIVFELKKENADAGGLALAEFVANEVTYCFFETMQGAAPTRFSGEFHGLINDILDQKQVSEMNAAAILESNGWKMQDSYCILRMISNGNVQSTHTLAYYCHLIERDFPYICAIERNEGIFCFVNQSLDKDNQTFQKQLPYFLRENLFLAGISCTFYNFLNGALYAREASYALTMGQKQNGSFWLHLFSDYTLDYCMRKVTEEYPVKDLIYPGLCILETYDREHPGTDLAITLREYLRQQYNATHTADKLHIHRTTFLYRLRRIEELTGIRLENEETRLHLQLSYALQDRS